MMDMRTEYEVWKQANQITRPGDEWQGRQPEIDAIQARIAQLEQERAETLAQEPVAWRYSDANGNYRYRKYVPNFDDEYSILRPIKLYAKPMPLQKSPA